VASDPRRPDAVNPSDRGIEPWITRRRFLIGMGAAAAATIPTPAFAALDCDPLTTPKSFLGIAPTPRSVLGFPLGVRREVTSRESSLYIDAVAAATDRVVAGTYGTSVEGRPLRYAVVGRPDNVTP
jgi:hypothetical protein